MVHEVATGGATGGAGEADGVAAFNTMPRRRSVLPLRQKVALALVPKLALTNVHWTHFELALLAASFVGGGFFAEVYLFHIKQIILLWSKN